MWLTTGWHSSACIRFVQQTIRLRGRVSLRADTLAEPVEAAFGAPFDRLRVRSPQKMKRDLETAAASYTT